MISGMKAPQETADIVNAGNAQMPDNSAGMLSSNEITNHATTITLPATNANTGSFRPIQDNLARAFFRSLGWTSAMIPSPAVTITIMTHVMNAGDAVSTYRV